MLKLREIDLTQAAERKSLLRFVRLHYRAASPLTDAALRSGKYRFFWAFDGKRLVGTTAYIAKTGTLAETVKTVVHPRLRGRGYGEALSLAMERELRRRGFRKLQTTIYVTNLAMLFIKLKQGYVFEGFHPHHERPGWHEYSLGKLLKPIS